LMLNSLKPFLFFACYYLDSIKTHVDRIAYLEYPVSKKCGIGSYLKVI